MAADYTDPAALLQSLLFRQMWEDPYNQAEAQRYQGIIAQPPPTPPNYLENAPMTGRQKAAVGLAALAQVISAYGHAKSLGTTPIQNYSGSILDAIRQSQAARRQQEYQAALAKYQGEQQGAQVGLKGVEQAQSAAERERQALETGQYGLAGRGLTADEAAQRAAEALDVRKAAQAETARHNAAMEAAAANKGNKPPKPPAPEPGPDKVAARQEAQRQDKAAVGLKQSILGLRQSATLSPLGFTKMVPPPDNPKGPLQPREMTMSELLNLYKQQIDALGLDHEHEADVLKYFMSTLSDYWRANKPSK